MSVWATPNRRPVATAMVFLGVVLLGLVAWQRIPVELLPPIGGDRLFVEFSRPGSDPEVLEREILVPLEARVGELPGVDEHWGEIRGSAGSFRVRFDPGVDLRLRELDLRRLAAELSRSQPRGTVIEVSSEDLGQVSQFVMVIQVTGPEDRHTLLDVVEERVVPRLSALPGLSQALPVGGGGREVTVLVDPERCAAHGIAPQEVALMLGRSVQRSQFLGGVEGAFGRNAVMLDGRPGGVVSLADLKIRPGEPTLLRHVASVKLGAGRDELLFRVNGRPSVGLVLFKEESANLVRLGSDARERLDLLRHELAPYGLDFVITFDAAELVQEQLDRLQELALSGFVIALAVLYLFLRQWRAVAVVGVAVPVSLLASLALLYLGGHSLNLVTLFGLAVGIGMLVDNSIVVYEAVQRLLERGASPDAAVEEGVRRTVRAILSSTACNAIVFLPIVFADFQSVMARELIAIMALAIVYPQLASLVVAVGLVPLLSRRLAARAALAKLAEDRRQRAELGGLVPPDRPREMFGGLLVTAMRRPGGWITSVTAAVLLTVIIALPFVALTTAAREPAETQAVRFSVELKDAGSLERAQAVFDRIEQPLRGLAGLRHVESLVREDGGAITVHLLPKDERPEEIGPGRVRELLRKAASEVGDVELTSEGATGGEGGQEEGGGGGVNALLGRSAASVVVSGPDARELQDLARAIQDRLASLPEIASATVPGRPGQDELRVVPDEAALTARAMLADEVLPALGALRREGVELRTGFTLPDGREIPLTVRRTPPPEEASAVSSLATLRLATPEGAVPLAALASIRKVPPPPAILHHDGRREISVFYTFSEQAPASGPARLALERQIRDAVGDVHRPPGSTIETPEAEAGLDWFRSILAPVVLLLYAVLAVTFESLTLPILVLFALPLTLLGATWALLLTGTPADQMALVGALALIGLTVNPAILLVDRMQQRVRAGGLGAGAAALAAVRERARPVLMTTTTAVAGLWPLALATGQENEIWPPFAIVVLGGLVTSTVLTLLVVPVGFVFLRRLDRLFGRLGPWIMLGWLAATALIMTPLIQADVITTMTWRILTSVVVASVLLGAAVLLVRRPVPPVPQLTDGTPAVQARYLTKIYGRPGPLGRAWRAHERFARRVLARGGRAFDPRRARERLLPRLLVASGAVYLALTLQTIFWRTTFLFVAAALAAALLRELRRARGHADVLGRVTSGGIENLLAALAPWGAWTWFVMDAYLLPSRAGERPDVRLWLVIATALVLAFCQLARRTAVRTAGGRATRATRSATLRRVRGYWRSFARRVFGLDLPREEVRALSAVHFEARRGMIGILGPNGAGKTTLLRQLAGILDPSVGRITIGGVPIGPLRRHLARYVGYLPQDFGLPGDLSAREYLEYYALLYEIEPRALRRERVERLLEEVGLAERAGERIGRYSGGMRQRVAVARTLLRLPPVIIVDEPTVGLDPRERIRFRNLLARLGEGRVVFFSTHVVEDVAVACERVLVLARGRLVFDGLPSALAVQAEGRVWELHLEPGAESALPPGALVVDQVPEETGWLRSRVLSATSPHPSARAIAPTLEDGYFWLVGTGSLQI